MALTLAPPKMLPPVMLPVADIVPIVDTLPTVAVPLTLRLVSVPTDVMLVCAAVCSVPVKLVAVMLPVPLTIPEPNNTLPPVMLPVVL